MADAIPGIAATMPSEAADIPTTELILPASTESDSSESGGIGPRPTEPINGTVPTRGTAGATIEATAPVAAAAPDFGGPLPNIPVPISAETDNFTHPAQPASIAAAEVAITPLAAPVAVICDVAATSSMSAAPNSALPPALAASPEEAAPAGVARSGPDSPRVVFIDPSATAAGDGSAAHPFSSWALVSLVAGNTYLQKAGTVLDGPLVLRGEGTDGAPIVIGSYGAGAPPVVHGSIVIERSAHLTLTGFTAEGSPYPGVIVRGGAHDITIAGNTIQKNGLGVWFSADSGGGNLVIGNTISGNATHGIAFDKTDHRGDPTMVANNLVEDNGCHGMEINANGVMAIGNTVSGNGHLIPGSSGIHVYGGVGRADGFGRDNIIVDNTVTDTHEAGQEFDGNGIQLDQFTARNIVLDNTVSANDGAGIILYDSSSNLVIGNTLSGNALDRSGSHPWLAELMLAGEDRFDLTGGNVITGNIVAPRNAEVEGLWIDALTADNPNRIGSNAIDPADGGAVFVGQGSALPSIGFASAGDVWLA